MFGDTICCSVLREIDTHREHYCKSQDINPAVQIHSRWQHQSIVIYATRVVGECLLLFVRIFPTSSFYFSKRNCLNHQYCLVRTRK
ncbi:hypothetical protein C0J52_00729 [Blattella germanica]|nr:hypothetical protein C0J52_00729 [Blattella germanica]